MTNHDQTLVELIRRYWSDEDNDGELAQGVVERAMGRAPCCLRELARAAQIADQLGPSPLKQRVHADLHESLSVDRELAWLVDDLGSTQQDPVHVVFDRLVDADTRVDLDGVDLTALRQARLGLPNRPTAARALLQALGWQRLEAGFSERLGGLLDALEKLAEEHQARALLVHPNGTGLAVGLQVTRSNKPGIKGFDHVDPAMDKQAGIVFDGFCPSGEGIRWQLEWPVSYSGSSVGLPLYVACEVVFENLPTDPLLAATGSVEPSGKVSAVEGISSKLSAAYQAGFRRVLLPDENRSEAEEAIADDARLGSMELVYVDHAQHIPDRLAQPTGVHEFSFEGRVRLARSSLPRYQLSLTRERSTGNSRQLHVADAAGHAIIDVYSGKKGRVRASGKAGPTLDTTNRLVSDCFDQGNAQPRDDLKRTVPDRWRADRLVELLASAGAERRNARGEGETWRYALRRGASAAQVTLWDTGTCVVTGSSPAFDDVAGFLTDVLGGLANVASSEAPQEQPNQSKPVEAPPKRRWIGTDESGKGDYFGPLVSAAVFVDESARQRLEELGVRDSKKLSERRVRDLAAGVREALPGKYKVTSIHPAKYNELYAQFSQEGKGLNSLLAWGHTRSIEDLLQRGADPDFAVVDQFADAGYIEGALMAGARRTGLNVRQYTKAESDTAVAAASILARDAFLAWMERAGNELDIALPKGASARVVEVAKGIYARGGLEELGTLAKLPFKTTKKATSED